MFQGSRNGVPLGLERDMYPSLQLVGGAVWDKNWRGKGQSQHTEKKATQPSPKAIHMLKSYRPKSLASPIGGVCMTAPSIHIMSTTPSTSDLQVISRRATGTTWKSVTGTILSLMRGTTMTWMSFGEIVTFID